MKRLTFLSSKSGVSLLTKTVATLLVPLQILTCWQMQVIAAADAPKTQGPPPGVTAEVEPLAAPARLAPKAVNRTLPRISSEVPASTFSTDPKDAEFFRSRAFDEPLLPMGDEATTKEENRALAGAIQSFAQDPTPDNTAPLEQFLAAHPKSPWRVSLLVNLGLLQRRGGYWTKALASWQTAWNLGRNEEESTRHLIVDRALAELAELTARVGRRADGEKLLAEAGARDVRGAATEKWATAKESFNLMKVEPEKSFRCGPLAVGRVYAVLHPDQAAPPEIHESVSTDHGVSLDQVAAFAGQLGMQYQIAFRSPGAAVVVPSVVHWKAGHYAAVTKAIEGRYLVQDTTFTADFVVSPRALDEEASGYFLVPAGKLPEGWRAVNAEEGKKVWGKGAVPPNTPPTPPCTSPTLRCPPCEDPDNPHMAGYNIDSSRINLILSDTPLFYQPPRGKTISFTINYSHREVAPSTVPNYPNLGPKWNFGWVCFVKDDPSNATTTTYGPGGGTLSYTGYTSTGAGTGKFAGQALNQSMLERTSATSYARNFPDGSRQVFGLADTSSPKRIYLTELFDPAGNRTAYTYDPVSFRLTGVTDALGQVTVLTYVSNDPLSTNGDYYRVASVTDPFGRTATLTYNGSGQLWKITDTAGFVSEFTYGTGDFVTKLTTPYGDTTFVSNDVGNDRSLLVTDPAGGQEYIEFKYDMVAPDNGAAVPTAAGLLTNTSFQRYRNTYHWDKKAYAEAKGDYSKAYLRHWLHTTSGGSMADVLESEKPALESRIYYNYKGQTDPLLVPVTGNLRTKIARVLDDGSTQFSQYDYNTQGKVTKVVTPGDLITPARTTTYSYAPNGIDVSAAYQQNPAGASIDPFSVAADKLSSLTYDAGGKHLVISSIDVAGRAKTFTYNSFGQVLTSTNALNETTTLVYDRDDDSDGKSDGYLVSVSGPAVGATTQLEYDGFARLWKTTNSDNDTITLGYEAIGGVPEKTLNRITQISYQDGTSEQLIYDRLDPQWKKDRLGRWTQVWYDSMRRVVAAVDPLNRVTQYQWCTCGSLESLIDGAGNQTTWIRDEQGRVVQKVYPDNTVVNTVHENRTSRVKSVTDAKGQRTNYDYFIDNSLRQVSYTDAAGAALVPMTPTVSFTYDAVYGRLLTMIDGIGTTQYNYNAITAPALIGAGRLATVDGPWGNDTIGYIYDELGRLAERSIDGAQNTASLGYDNLGRVSSVANPLGVFTYSYVGVTGRLDHVDYPNGQKTLFSYFGGGGARRLQRIKHVDSGAALISQFDYTYDAVGNVATWTQNYSGLTNPRQYAFGYDELDQLTSGTLKDTVTSSALREQAFQYDAAGNRVTVQDNNMVATEKVNELNQLTQVVGGGMMRFAGTLSKQANVTVGGSPATVRGDNTFEGHAPVSGSGTTRVHIVATDVDNNVTAKYMDVTTSAVGNKAQTYDPNGNILTSGPAGAPNVAYEWDAANRLVKIVQGADTTTYEYDGEGRRVMEKFNGVETRRWIWCGFELCEERDSNNITTKRFYGRGQQLGGVAYYASCDHLGSIRELTDANGVVRARYDYDLDGRRSNNVVTSNQVDSDLGFSGLYECSTLGLTAAPLRFFDSASRRWLSRDPTGELDGSNVYEYAHGNPLRYIDPIGGTGVEAVAGAALLDSPALAPVAGLTTAAETEAAVAALGGSSLGAGAIFPILAAAAVGAGIGTAIGIPLSKWLIPPATPPPMPVTNTAGANGTYPTSPLPAKSPDPVRLPKVNPGRGGCGGGCLPCPPNSPAWEVLEPGHGGQTHWHWIEYNQKLDTCECYPVRRSGPTKPPGA